jgi:hypothetical protein
MTTLNKIEDFKLIKGQYSLPHYKFKSSASIFLDNVLLPKRNRRGRNRMVVGFTTTCVPMYSFSRH